MKHDLRVLFEDNHILAVEKPPGILAQADRTGDTSLLEMAKEYLKQKYQKPGAVYLGLVHRLDRPTGGVIVFARTSKAAGRLSAQFRDRSVKKTYLALCQGVPDPTQGELRHTLGFDEKKRRAIVCPAGTPQSKAALLNYRVLQTKRGRALVEVKPVTGRKHQIRVQMASIGHPLVGDAKYSKKPSGGRVVKAIGLWASEIQLVHPVRREPLCLACYPDPELQPLWMDFSEFLSSLPCREG